MVEIDASKLLCYLTHVKPEHSLVKLALEYDLCRDINFCHMRGVCDGVLTIARHTLLEYLIGDKQDHPQAYNANHNEIPNHGRLVDKAERLHKKIFFERDLTDNVFKSWRSLPQDLTLKQVCFKNLLFYFS